MENLALLTSLEFEVSANFLKKREFDTCQTCLKLFFKDYQMYIIQSVKSYRKFLARETVGRNKLFVKSTLSRSSEVC